MKVFIVLMGIIAISLGLQSCATCNCNSDSKLDAKSKERLQDFEDKNALDEINFLAEFTAAPTDSQIEELKEMGVKNITKAGNIVSGNAQAKIIRKLLKFDYVKIVEIAKLKSIK